MRASGKKGARDVRTPGETTRAEHASSAAATKAIASTDTLSRGRGSTPTLSDAHHDVTRAFGLVLATPGVEEALRAAGRWDGARRLLLRHLEIATARGES